jgi:hypothetical protein
MREEKNGRQRKVMTRQIVKKNPSSINGGSGNSLLLFPFIDINEDSIKDRQKSV